MKKTLLITLMTGGLAFVVLSFHAHAQQEGVMLPANSQISFKDLAGRYRQAGANQQRTDILKQMRKYEPRTTDDVEQIRMIFSAQVFDEELFLAAMQAAKKIRSAQLAAGLIEILQDEKNFVEKAGQGTVSGKSRKETMLRHKNIEAIVRKTGELRSREAIPILKEYLAFRNMQYAASEALTAIGEPGASEELRERAYRGENINYGGAGLDEAARIVQDLGDKSKKDKWPKIAKQIILIKDPRAKEHLKKLFSHEKDYVRNEAATVFSKLADVNDSGTILDMAGNKDWFVRDSAIDAMKRINDAAFNDLLINMLIDDPKQVVRASAAKAAGYKKITAAVQSLQKALNDKDAEVRLQAFIALYVITGTKYDYKGRDAAAEQQAERQRKSPTFY